MGILWKGVNECCRKNVPDRWRIEWREEKRLFSLESRENKAGCFLLCEVRDEEGKKHRLIFPEGKDKKKGCENLAYKLNELGISDKKGEKSTLQVANILKGRRSFADTVKPQGNQVNTIWVEAGDPDTSSMWGKLKNSLVGSWKQNPDCIPLSRELESWARAVWKLQGGVSVAFLNQDLLLFEFDFLEDSNYVMERGCNAFRGGVLKLERWRPESGCVKNKNFRKEAWIRVLGLPLHLWTREMLKQIGDGCGGFLKVDEETGLGSEISWVRILVRIREEVKPSTVNILAGLRSYELQIWWELSPWVAEVYPSKMEVEEALQKRREEDEHRWRVAKGASSGPGHIKTDGRTGMTGGLKTVQSYGVTAPSPRKASDYGSRLEQVIPTEELSSKAEPDGLASAVVGPTPLVGKFRPNGAIDFTNVLGPDSQPDPKPKDHSKIKATPPILLKKNTIRANDSQDSSAEDRYSHTKPLHSPNSSSCLDRSLQLEEPFGHRGTVETSQASEGAERVGALTPSADPMPSTRFLSRVSVTVEERKIQQGEDGDKDANMEAQQVGDSTWVESASSAATLRSSRTEIAMDGEIRKTKMESLMVGYPPKVGPERLSPVKGGTSPSKGGEPKPTTSSQALGPSWLSSPRSKECSSDKDGIPSFLHKDKAKDIILSSEDERYCSPMLLYSFPSSPCLDQTPHLGESLGHGGPADIPQDCVGSQGIVLTPLAILPPSSSTRPPCWDLMAMQGRELLQCEDGDKDENRGNETLAEVKESWDESCLARFSKFLGFSTAGYEEEILEFLKRFNGGRKRGKGKGGDRTTKFDREMKKLAWNVTDKIRKKDGGLGKEVRAYHYNS